VRGCDARAHGDPRGTGGIRQRQFVVADPDGYLLRFARVVGTQV